MDLDNLNASYIFIPYVVMLHSNVDQRYSHFGICKRLKFNVCYDSFDIFTSMAKKPQWNIYVK